MKAASIDTWIWRLIFGGGLFAALGIAVGRGGEPLGWIGAGAGGVAAAVGVVLIFVRARMPP